MVKEREALTRGYQLVRQGDLEAASSYFAALARDEARSAEAHFNLGKILFKLQRLAEARTEFLRAVDCGASPELVWGILEVTNWRLLASPRFFNSSPVFSPDGRRVIFCSARRDGNGDGRVDAFDRPGLYLVDLETGKERQLVSDDSYNTSPAFCPDGRAIMILSTRRDTNHDGVIDHRDTPALYEVELETGRESLLVGEEWAPRFPSLSPDGQTVLFCGTSKPHVVVCACDRTTRAVRFISGVPAHHTFPSWHPTGRAVVYSSWREDTNGDGVIDAQDHSAIFFQDLVTHRERCLVDPKTGSHAYPACSPDGERVVFLARRGGSPGRRRDTQQGELAGSVANAGIRWVNVDGREEQQVVDDRVDNRFPAWSADSRWILFLRSWSAGERSLPSDERYHNNKGIYRVNVAGGQIVQLVSDKFFGSRFCVPAPRGSQIAYVSWRPGTNRGLFLADTDRLPSPPELRRWIVANLADEAVFP